MKTGGWVMGRGRGIGSQVTILLLVTSMLFSHLSMPLELDEVPCLLYLYLLNSTENKDQREGEMGDMGEYR
jgi:hypothetical protein